MKQPSYIYTFLAALYLLFPAFCLAQDSTSATPVVDSTQLTSPLAVPPTPASASGNKAASLQALFLKNDVEIKNSDIISNVIRVTNGTAEPQVFAIDLSIPSGWKSLSANSKVYELAPGDTLYIPVRIIPTFSMKGNTNYIINAFVINDLGKQAANIFFIAFIQKEIRWELNVEPGEKIYFKNGEKEAPFSVNIFNAGNEEQDILLSFSDIGSNTILKDTADVILKKRFYDLTLAQQRDTTFKMKLGYMNRKRNHAKVDLENYRPRSELDEKKYYLYLKTREPRQITNKTYQANKRILFYKLSNEKKIHPYGSSVLPLTVDANIYNVLGFQPMMNLYMRGSTLLNNGANLVYFTQFNYSSYNFTKNPFKHHSYLLGYYHKKGDIAIGNVNGGGFSGMSIAGKGVTGHYNINDRHKVGAFYVSRPTIFVKKTDRVSYGINHTYSFKDNKKLYSQYGHTNNKTGKMSTDFLSFRSGVSINKMHRIGIGVTGTRSYYYAVKGKEYEKYGYFVNTSYGGSFLDNALSTTLRFTFSSRNFNGGYGEQYIAFNRSVYNINKKWQAILQNNLDHYQSPYLQGNKTVDIYNTIFHNQLFFSRNTKIGAIMPSLYYNTSNIALFRLHSRGLGMNYSYFNVDNFFRASVYVKGGYNDAIDYSSVKEYFTLQLFYQMQYRSLTFNTRYNYGPEAIRDIASITNRYPYPQYFSMSLQHQYLFANTRLILVSAANYSYNNQFYSHSMGYFPELYYYSLNGWRFKLNAGYSFSSSNIRRSSQYSSTIRHGEADPKAHISQGFNMGVGIRKEFGIPIPKKISKARFNSIEFLAFLDINGNRIKDSDELPLENVVIRTDDHEVLTNDKGVAKIINLEGGKNYALNAFSLADLGGWFPVPYDSLNYDTLKKQLPVPFVKGVKLYGNIVLDREKYAADAEVPKDLSHILITATDSAGKAYSTLTGYDGQFVVYVPFGKYILTMDEAVLGERFMLAQNNIALELKQGIESIYSSFYVIEKRRKIIRKKFNTNGNEVHPADTTGSITPKDTTAKTAFTAADKGKRDAIFARSLPAASLKGLVYTVQVGAFKLPLDPERFNALKDLVSEETGDGFVRIASGQYISFKDADKARTEIIKTGFEEAFVAAYYNGKKITLKEAARRTKR